MQELFQQVDMGAYLLNLLLCLVAGYAIGVEREARGKSAGIATQCLVMGGAMTFTFLSFLITNDAARISAGIVTGVGFLGAGIIFHQSKDKVANLTTAATLWFSAAIGMAIGFGAYALAIAAVVFAIIALRIPHPFRHDS